MIQSLEIVQFKSLKNICLDVAPLTLLSGQNGSGKSSLLQALLLLKENAWKQSGNYSASLETPFYSLGHQSDIFYQWASERTLHISAFAETEGRLVFSASGSSETSDWDSVDFRLDVDKKHLAENLSNIQYLSADRIGPRSEHALSRKAMSAKFWGSHGENAVAILSANKDQEVIPELLHENSNDTTLQGQLDAWMQEISPGAAIRTEQTQNKAILKIGFGRGRGGREFRPENVGFGISISLPILTMVLSARKGDCLIVENPEAHLHPRGQASIGRLFAKAAAAGIQMFVETHSDHVLNGVRVAVKNGILDSKKAVIAFFERRTEQTQNGLEEQFSHIRQLRIDNDGEMDDYPVGFLDEWAFQLAKLLK